MSDKLIPNHIGFILDGNRRWARQRGMPTFYGHKKGYDNLKKISQLCFDAGIKTVSAFVFSTENWKRSEPEVTYLMELLEKALVEQVEELGKKGIKLVISGSKDKLSKEILGLIDQAEQKTAKNKKGILNLCLNYGGRVEIIEATKRMIDDGLTSKEINEDTFNKYLWTGELDSPDFIIRTSGEHRLSGFLTWKGVYAELMFVKKHWPGFNKKDLEKVLEEYKNRNRRFGGN